jgi:hypothetical protein
LHPEPKGASTNNGSPTRERERFVRACVRLVPPRRCDSCGWRFRRPESPTHGSREYCRVSPATQNRRCVNPRLGSP